MSQPQTNQQQVYCLLTGATSGIGRATAINLAKQGVHLTVLCRDKNKGHALLAELKDVAVYPVDLMLADLSNQQDIRDVAKTYLDSDKPLNLLINNAGVVNTSRKLTVDGIEETFAVNHLGYFLLTNLLLPRIEQSASARIVNVASNAYTFVRDMNIDDINSTKEYKTFQVYGRSKLGNILFTKALARKLADKPITVNCLHPGAVGTGLGTNNNGLMGKLLPLILKPFFKSADQGAETSLYLALSPEVADISGEYFSNCKPLKLKPWACDEAEAAKLWQLSEKMTGLVPS